jgi:phage-related holin
MVWRKQPTESTVTFKSDATDQAIYDTPLRSAMIFFYLSNEGLSIIENLGTLGVPIPRRLKRLVAELGEEDRDGGEK